jgi:hypothetical protein
VKFLQESVFGDSLIELATFAVLVLGYPLMWWRTHNCHMRGCPRLQWHINPRHGHPVCKHHHPDHPAGGGGHRLLES